MSAPEFRRQLLRWYRKNGRDLPWRRTRDPYAIAVSEVMLQQTQVASVLPYYERWLRKFPTFGKLARASEADVLHAWQGLGYYARARNLHATAKAIVTAHRGRFPKMIDDMRTLPGFGQYTAHAIATFAFGQAVPIVEANSARVLSRLFDLRTPIDSGVGRNKLWEQAALLVPKNNAAAYNSALLDLGALICLPRSPKCAVCPVKRFCAAKNPESLPIKRPRLKTKQLVENHALVMKGDKVALAKSQRRWRGLWILPPLDGLKPSGLPRSIHTSVFPFTNHRITLQIFPVGLRKISHREARWFSRRELESLPIPSPHWRAIKALLN